ncbi:MAG: phosphoenolpyruvate carboxylase [Bifidobacteriaceae bacterium]|jgi:phosphoenolpyruvate carboxylase|nr:phosphoenolpyruvate carboxylase [Bifidobacteriaceae bacterium]
MSRSISSNVTQGNESASTGSFYALASDTQNIDAINLGIRTIRVSTKLYDNLHYLLQLLNNVLQEYDESLLADFNYLQELAHKFHDSADNSATAKQAFSDAEKFIDEMRIDRAEEITRAFACYFHLSNIAEKNYRTGRIIDYEAEKNPNSAPLLAAYDALENEVGAEKTLELAKKLRFHPVLTAHPTEARRNTVTAKISRISDLLVARKNLSGTGLIDNERRTLFEIDALFRTSLIAHKKPTPIEESDVILSIFDRTFAVTIIDIVRKLDNHIAKSSLGLKTANMKPFVRIGSWIGADRDGNSNVTAEVTEKVSQKMHKHIMQTYREMCLKLSQNMTHDFRFTKGNAKLIALFERLVKSDAIIENEIESGVAYNYESMIPMGATSLSAPRARELFEVEPYKATILLIAQGVDYKNGAYYKRPEEFLEDLYIVQSSLIENNAVRSAYGQLLTLIWTVQVFGFHLAELEYRQHAKVHKKALDEIRTLDESEFSEQTKEFLESIRVFGDIQAKFGTNALKRYIVSFTTSAEDLEDLYLLFEYVFSKKNDTVTANMPHVAVIPLFETLEDLENAVHILDDTLKIRFVQETLAKNNREFEVMLGYSDSSKEIGPLSATLALDATEEKLARWAKENDINLTLFHGRGGTMGRGGGSVSKAILAEPQGATNGRFKLTEQGEVIFERYGEPALAARHIESVLAATLLHDSPSQIAKNATTKASFADLRTLLDTASREKYRELIETDGFYDWFSKVTPFNELREYPLGSRPVSRGLYTDGFEDLRAIPWVFSWSQARINLAAWYGVGSALRAVDDMKLLRKAYKEWELFATIINNTEMSIAKTDFRIAKQYLAFGERADLAKLVLNELYLTRKFVLKVTKNAYPLENHPILGQAIKIRSPYVDALSIIQSNAIKSLRNDTPSNPEKREQFKNLVLSTVSAISAGLQNTG